jgi:deoxycytidylate deaminase
MFADAMNAIKDVPARMVPDRDSKYMGMAWMLAAFSKDPDHQSGAIIVDDVNDGIIAHGWTDCSKEIQDTAFSWTSISDGTGRLNKRDLCHHAEYNAHTDFSLSTHKDLVDATLYVTELPCKNCIALYQRTGLAEIIYYDPHVNYNFNDDDRTRLCKEMARLHGIKMTAFRGNLCWMPDWVKILQNQGIFEG